MTKKLILILGGVRSGKSSFAAEMAKDSGDSVTYVATGNSSDPEMRRRIKKHQQLRPKEWRTVGAREDAISVLREADKAGGLVIFDCLTLFISNLLEREDFSEAIADAQREVEIIKKVSDLVETFKKLKSSVIVVSNEVGLGIVPPFPAGRLFRDLTGMANRKVAKVADEVYFMMAGIPVKIKG